MNRFAILGAMGVAVIVAALLLNYAINRDEVVDTSQPAGAVAPATAPSAAPSQPAAPTSPAPAGTQGSTSPAQTGAAPAGGAASNGVAPTGTTPTGTAASSSQQANAAPSAGNSAPTTAGQAPAAGQPAAAAVPPGGGAPATPVAKPSFDIVRVNPDGGMVVAGRAPPRSTVVLTADGQTIGSIVADDRGEWVLLPGSKLAPGNHQLAITSQVPDAKPVLSDDIVVVVVPQPQVAANGQPAAGGQPGTLSGTAQPSQPLAVVVPRTDQGSTVLQAPNPPQSGLLVLRSVDYDSGGLLIIGGEAPPGAQVRAYLDNHYVGVAQADAAGRWHIRPPQAVGPGVHNLRIDQVDPAGKVLSRLESPFSRAAPLNVAAGDQVVVVQPGNNLWLIATRIYGSGFRYTTIYAANKTQITNPDLIFPGQVFKLPTPAASN